MLRFHDGPGGCDGSGPVVESKRNQVLYQFPVCALEGSEFQGGLQDGLAVAERGADLL